MPFVHLLLLLLLPVGSECLTVGTEFIAVFPENIAYYHPSSASLQLRITALHDGTTVDLDPASITVGSGPSYNLQSGNITTIDIDPEQELDKSNFSNKVAKISSNKDIAVEIVSHRNNSLQTALLLPTDQLGKEYQVPPIPETQLYDITGTIAVTERSPFKLIFVNSEESSNVITFQGTSVELDSKQLVQFWVTNDMVDDLVIGSKPFLALLAHPCTIQFGCTCGALYTPLRPHNTTKLTYIVPPAFRGATRTTYLLKPSDDSPVEFTSESYMEMEENGPVMLQKPGMLMNLIPEEEFCSCFSIQTVEDAAENWAVIVAPAESTEDVQYGNSQAGDTWSSITETIKYKYAKIPLSETENVIWHKSGLMAVYFLGKKIQDRDAWFGNPAACLSKKPDRRGCVLEPEIMKVHHEAGSWQESIRACKTQDLELISLSDPFLQNQIYNWTLGLNQNLTELWIGLHKSSYSDEWYWINEDPLDHQDWSHGSPGGPNDGQCGQISLKDSENPGWIHHDCCKTAKAVCYKPPKLVTI